MHNVYWDTLYKAENAKKKINEQLHFLIHRMLLVVERMILGKKVEYGIILYTHILKKNWRFVRHMLTIWCFKTRKHVIKMVWLYRNTDIEGAQYF